MRSTALPTPLHPRWGTGERIGMTKSEFARQMGIRKQNVKALFKSKNLETVHKAAGVLGVPFEMLVGYIEEPDLSEIPITPL